MTVYALAVAGADSAWPAARAAASDPPPDAAASEQPYRLPPILVTGENSPLQPGPGAITTLSGAQLEADRVLSPRDFTALAPNVGVFDANGDRIPRFSVRGLRENNFSIGEPVVSMYIDDVPYNDLYSRGLPLFEIDRIEFLRGPQGTAFGASRPGGVLNLLTKLPGDTWAGSGRVSYGNYDDQRYQAAVRGPIDRNHLFLGVSGVFAQRDGFVKNTQLGTHGDTRETLTGRIQLRWTPSEAWDFTYTQTGDRFHDGFVHVVPIDTPDKFTVARDFDGHVETRSHTEALRAAFSATRLKVVSVTTHRDWRQDLLQDFDFSAADLVRGFTQPKIAQWTQELRFQSPDPDDQVKWAAGGYFSDKGVRHESGSRLSGVTLPVPPFAYVPGPFTDTTTARLAETDYALFGEATCTWFDKLDVTAGLRFDYALRGLRRQHAPYQFPFAPPAAIPDVNLDEHFSSLQPKLGLAYRFRKDLSVYFNAAQGFQSGGFNVSNDNPQQAVFDSANLCHYEVGAKSAWLKDRLFANLNLFYVDSQDYQVYKPITSVAYQMLNARQATTLGAELELIGRPADGLEVSAALGYTRARFDSFNDPANNATYDGNTINFVPQYTANLAVQYRFAGGFFARLELATVGHFYYDEANLREQKTYALFNARAGWENKHFGVYLFGRNLLDKEYFNNAINFRNPRDNSDLFVGTPGDPLTFGGEVVARF